jgi:hypothetical protein
LGTPLFTPERTTARALCTKPGGACAAAIADAWHHEDPATYVGHAFRAAPLPAHNMLFWPLLHSASAPPRPVPGTSSPPPTVGPEFKEAVVAPWAGANHTLFFTGNITNWVWGPTQISSCHPSPLVRPTQPDGVGFLSFHLASPPDAQVQDASWMVRMRLLARVPTVFADLRKIKHLRLPPTTSGVTAV